MGLVEVKNNTKVRVASIDGDRQARAKIMSMGIIPGAVVRILRKDGQSPMLLSVMGQTVMICHSLAKNISVR